MLTEAEHQEIVSILRDWAELVPDVPLVSFLRYATEESPIGLTPRQLAAAAAERTPDGQALLEILEHGLRREGMETMRRRFTEMRRYTEIEVDW